MEFRQKTFTPKAVNKIASRQSPYSSGKSCITNYKKYNAYSAKSDNLVTPPRKPFISNNNQRLVSSTGKLKSFRCTAQNANSRGINILRHSQQKSDTKENSSDGKWIAKPEVKRVPFVSSAKRSLLPFSAAGSNGDPHGVFDSDEDNDDVCLADRYNPIDLNKENRTFNKSTSLPSPQSTAKRKPLNTLHSSLLPDISPIKISRAYPAKGNSSKTDNCSYTFKSFGDKENNFTTLVNSEEKIFTEQPYMIGPIRRKNDKLNSSMEKVKWPRPSIRHEEEMHPKKLPGAASSDHDLKETLKNRVLVERFLNYGNTCYLNAVLQTLVGLEPFVVGISGIVNKADLSSCSLTQSLWDVIFGRKKRNSAAVMKALRNLKENVEKIDGSFSGFKMQDANEFLTQLLDTIKDEIDKYINDMCCNSGTTALSRLNSSKAIKESTFSTQANNGHSSLFDTPSPDSLVSLDLKLSDSNSSEDDRDDIFINQNEATLSDIINLTPEKSVNSKLSAYSCDNKLTPAKKDEEFAFVNPVKENFEFELLESYRCLGCGDVERRKQKHFALYVNLPTDGNDSIQHAVESYMMEDQRELTCEKCSHKKASVITQFENLPRILIVQLKRYEYKHEQLECIKVSSKVEVNMWLQLDSILSKTGNPPPPWIDKLLRIDTPVETRRKETKLNSTLSVRNLSSELNICAEVDKETSVNKNENNSSLFSISSCAQDTRNEDCDSNDKELEEMAMQSLEDVSSNQQPDTEEEEFQKAIKLSLQDMGMCFSQDLPSTGADKNLPHFSNEAKSPLNKGYKHEDELAHQELNGQHSYRLLSVISHFGLTTCTGHYVSDIFNFDENQWFHYDDESVVRLQDSVVLAEGRQKNGYIFFYVHQDVYQRLRN